MLFKLSFNARQSKFTLFFIFLQSIPTLRKNKNSNKSKAKQKVLKKTNYIFVSSKYRANTTQQHNI